jgi:hypothetical protein
MRWFLTQKNLLIGFAWLVINKSMGDDLNFTLHIRDLQQLKKSCCNHSYIFLSMNLQGTIA